MTKQQRRLYRTAGISTAPTKQALKLRKRMVMTWAALAGFAARHALRPELSPDGTIRVTDADYGEVVFAADGTVEAEGRRLDPRDWTLAGTRREIALG